MSRGLMLGGLLVVSCLFGCTPEVGSQAWCEHMEEKPKGDWTANEAADYARHCLLRSDE